MQFFRNPIWTPTEADLSTSSMAKFRDYCNRKYKNNLGGYDELHSWSVDPATACDFWMALFEFLDIGATVKPTKVFTKGHPKTLYPSPEFFPDARLNFAGSVLLNRDPNAVAILEMQEGSLDATEITWRMLHRQVERVADAMRTTGIAKGDRVAALIANTEQSITFCLAALSIGAIWSSISPDFGAQGILDRLIQVKPKLLFANPSVIYNGKVRNLMPTIIDVANVLVKDDSLANIVFTADQPTIATVPKGINLTVFLSRGIGRKLSFEQMPFNQPAFILYSSGTTGAPKCIVHSAGGVMLQIKKDYILHTGVLPTDIVFQYTTTSWVMWVFVLTVMSTGATVVLYSGSPLYPSVKFFPEILSKFKVSVFGTSAKYLTDLMASKAQPRNEHDMSALRKVTSTGSVLPADVAIWFYEYGFPTQVQLISGSGGTDCSCSFVTGNPMLPLYADEIQAKSLGMAVQVFEPNDGDRKGSPVSLDELGELVCTQPFPSQPVTFWGSNGEKRYFDSYFEIFGDSTWVQGDLIRISKATRGIQMLGRSDGVLNPSGVRFGSAEIYNVVRQFLMVEDSVCVGQRRPHDKDETVILFLKVPKRSQRTEDLISKIKSRIERYLSKRHVPIYVFYIDDIPYSNVGKKLETVVKNIVCGRQVSSVVVGNPESLPLYEPYYKSEEMARKHTTASLKL